MLGDRVAAGLAAAWLICSCGSSGRDDGDSIGTFDGGEPITPPPADDCPGGTNACGTECVDLDTDPLHCGACGRACGVGEPCQGAACQAAVDCREEPCSGFTYCDLGTGICERGCILDEQCAAGRVCEPSSHECGCPAGMQDCSGACRPCPTDFAAIAFGCGGSSCVISDCEDGYVLCDGRCHELPEELPPGSIECVDGELVTRLDGGTVLPTDGGILFCPAGSLICDGECVECPEGDGASSFGCRDGECVATGCESGMYVCSSGCCSWTTETVSTANHIMGIDILGNATGASVAAWVNWDGIGGATGTHKSLLTAARNDLTSSWTVTSRRSRWEMSYPVIGRPGTTFYYLARDVITDGNSLYSTSSATGERLLEMYGYGVLADRGYPFFNHGAAGSTTVYVKTSSTATATTVYRGTSPRLVTAVGSISNVHYFLYDGSAMAHGYSTGGTTWSQETLTDPVFSPAWTSYDAALDPSTGYPHLFMCWSGTPVHAWREGTTWMSENLSVPVGNCVGAIDESGVIHIAHGSSTSSEVTYLRKDEEGWTTSIAAVVTNQLSTIAIDADVGGSPHIFFADETVTSPRTATLRYVH